MRTKAETNMVKTKLLLLLCIIFLINACSLIGKKNKNKETKENLNLDSELIIEEINIHQYHNQAVSFRHSDPRANTRIDRHSSESTEGYS